jgi:hypothetical protein
VLAKRVRYVRMINLTYHHMMLKLSACADHAPCINGTACATLPTLPVLAYHGTTCDMRCTLVTLGHQGHWQ